MLSIFGELRKSRSIVSSLFVHRTFAKKFKIFQEDLSLTSPDAYPQFSVPSSFDYQRIINWYPGHMHNALIEIDKYADKVDCVIDVRDARAPYSSAQHELLKRIPNHIPRLIVLNKADLVHPDLVREAERTLTSLGHHVVSTCATSKKGVVKIRQYIRMSGRGRTDDGRPAKFKSLGQWAMIVGLPNVGKSSIITALKESTYDMAFHLARDRGLKGPMNLDRSVGGEMIRDLSNTKPKTGILAGLTKMVVPYQLSVKPLLYVVDTPGVFFGLSSESPHLLTMLAALGCVDDTAGGVNGSSIRQYVAQYVLWELNRRKLFHYMDVFGLSEPVEDVLDLGALIGHQVKSGRASFNSASSRDAIGGNYQGLDSALDLFLRLYRQGHFGHFMLEETPHVPEYLVPAPGLGRVQQQWWGENQRQREGGNNRAAGGESSGSFSESSGTEDAENENSPSVASSPAVDEDFSPVSEDNNEGGSSVSIPGLTGSPLLRSTRDSEGGPSLGLPKGKRSLQAVQRMMPAHMVAAAREGNSLSGPAVDLRLLPSEPPDPWSTREYPAVHPGLLGASQVGLIDGLAVRKRASQGMIDRPLTKANSTRKRLR